jgi:Aldo/keto reductase family/Glycosyl hydrolases family 15
VRTGNAAVKQVQLDVYGEVMDALHKATELGIQVHPSTWALQRALLEFLEGNWQRPDEGIWEVRGPRRHFTHSKVLAWVAMASPRPAPTHATCASRPRARTPPGTEALGWTGPPTDQGVGAVQQRRLGRTGHQSSVLIYGAAALAEVDQDTADASVQLALDAGINHFDVAASYGDAELRLGPWMGRIRDRIFLATKTGLRDRDDAWTQVNRSLERLETDRLDLIQVHAVGDLEELDLVTRPGGSLEAVVRARDEGLAAAIGITGHGHQAPATHLEALRRFPFDTVLTPLNWVLGQDPAYVADYQALVAEVQAQDVGLMIIKAASRRNWPSQATPAYTTWYEPFDDQERIDAAVAWVLSHPEVTGIATPGDVRLLPLVVEAERRLDRASPAAAGEVLAQAGDYSSPFLRMPF